MRQQNIEKIRQACVKANEDILRLRFGVKIIWKAIYDNKEKEAIVNKIYSRTTKYVTGTEFVGECILDDDDSTTAFCKENVVKVLGRPIRFLDILLAIGKTKNYIAIDDMGQILQQAYREDGANYMGEMVGTTRFWVLNRDDLNDQTDETVEFIANFLPDQK